ncbi:MAG: type II methionyl aminopeptidase [Candidatus Bathyarchaeota archaeon]
MLAGDTLECYVKAGHIASEVRNKIKETIKEGTLILKICETVENSIRKMGGEPAFPCNVCINNIAAHYSSPPNDLTVIPKNAVVKVDLGVQVKGHIADTAITVSLCPQYDSMKYAVDDALEHAIRAIKPKAKISEVGTIIKQTIEKYGFKPIRNLSGHQMSRYVLHAGKSIPNVPTIYLQRIVEDEVYAVEPFLTLTSGKGEVKNSNNSYIYRFQKERHLKSAEARALLATIKSNFKSLPFSERWIKGIEEKQIREAFAEIVEKKCVYAYPVLVEATDGIVTQAEHTVIVTKQGCRVTTR